MERIGAAWKIIDRPPHDKTGSWRNTDPDAGHRNRLRRRFILNHTHRSRPGRILWQAPLTPDHQGGRFGTLNEFPETNSGLPLGREHWTQELCEKASGNE